MAFVYSASVFKEIAKELGLADQNLQDESLRYSNL